MIEDLEARLAAMAGDWADAPADTGSIYAPPPDGEYQALIHNFDFIESNETPKRIYLKVTYQIDNEAEYSGRRVDTLFGLEDPDRIKWLKSWLARLIGAERVEQTPITDVRPSSPLLNELLDVPVLIKVKRSDRAVDNEGNPRVNIYLQQRLGDSLNGQLLARKSSDVTQQPSLDDFAPAVGRSAINDDDDIPF